MKFWSQNWAHQITIFKIRKLVLKVHHQLLEGGSQNTWSNLALSLLVPTELAKLNFATNITIKICWMLYSHICFHFEFFENIMHVYLAKQCTFNTNKHLFCNLFTNQNKYFLNMLIQNMKSLQILKPKDPIQYILQPFLHLYDGLQFGAVISLCFQEIIKLLIMYGH